MEKEYLTVKEFAEAEGVSTQRIYQRLAKDLQSYCKQENGVTLISIKGLKISCLQSACKGLAKDLQSVEPSVDAEEEAAEGDPLAKDLQSTCNYDLIEALRERIAAQEKTIEHQQQTINSLTAALTGAQQLQYMEKQERMKLLEVAEAESSEHLPDEVERAADQSGEPSVDDAECGHSERGKVHFFEYVWQSITGKAKKDNHKDNTEAIK